MRNTPGEHVRETFGPDSGGTRPAGVSPDRFRRMVRARWRALTGGRRVRDADRATVLACSGGADSSALVLALAGARARLVVAHVEHDLRPPDQTEKDAEATGDLAARCGLEFVRTRVRARGGRGNAESVARRERYRVLARVAAERGCVFVATGHHADDQAETVVMRLLRGAGPGALAGMAETRGLAGEDRSPGAQLIRPMLGARGVDARAFCVDRGWAWREDATNADVSRVRARLRAEVMPVLWELSPELAERVAVSARVLRDAGGLLVERAESVRARGRCAPEAGGASGVVLRRAVLSVERLSVIGQVLRASHDELAPGRGADARSGGLALSIARVIAGTGTDPKAFDFGACRVVVTSREVRIEPKGSADAQVDEFGLDGA